MKVEVEGKVEKGITGKVGEWEESASARKEEEGGKSELQRIPTLRFNLRDDRALIKHRNHRS